MGDGADVKTKVTLEVSLGKARTRELAVTRSSCLQLLRADLSLSKGGSLGKWFRRVLL